jgi:hypothetical protein
MDENGIKWYKKENFDAFGNLPTDPNWQKQASLTQQIEKRNKRQ